MSQTNMKVIVSSELTSNSGGQEKLDMLYVLTVNGWSYDKTPTVNLIELRKKHILVLETLQ
jgi:hypothetical protein